MGQESKSIGELARMRYWKQRDAEVVIAAWRDSGESMASFARRWSIKAKRIGRWAARLEARCAPDTGRAVGESGHGVEDEDGVTSEEQAEQASIAFHPVCLVESPPRAVSPSVGHEAAFLAELRREQWTVRVPLGFEAGEMARLLEVVTQVEQC